VEETMTKTNQQIDQQTKRQQALAPVQASEPTNLSFLYGSIGIQAVAAAARYADRRKSPANAPASGLRIDLRFVESAS
jgi:DNA transposition AAA+ family ATPase